MDSRISFVVPVRNDAVRLERCLRRIRTADSDKAAEIVVVDNGSVDASPEVARTFGARVLVIEQARVSELRNRGAAHASGDVLAFVDADNEIADGWIQAALANLQSEDVGATGALYLAPAGGTAVQRAYGLLRGRTLTRGDVDWLGSGNLAVRRQVFEQVQGFDTTLEACEDVDLCHRIRAAGFRVLGDPRLESIHLGDPRTLADLFRSELWRGRDNLRVSLRRPIEWTSLPSAILPIVDATFLVAALAGLTAWLTGWQAGLLLALTALALVAVGAFAKVLRAVNREPEFRPSEIPTAFVAACVYDVARSVALFRRVPHRRTHPRAATTPAL